MRNNVLASFTVLTAAFAVAPAHAGDWSENVNLCAAAAEAEGVVTAGEYRAKFVYGSGASVKTVAIELIPNEGETITAQCKIRRGAVTEFGVKA